MAQEPLLEPEDFEDDEEEPEVEEFMEIGGSPVPGITLKAILRGHTGTINRMAWSPDGRYLASPSMDHTVRLWDGKNGDCLSVIETINAKINSISWSPDGKMIAVNSDDGKFRILESANEKIVSRIDSIDNRSFCAEWSPNGEFIAIGTGSKILIWDVKDRGIINSLTGVHGVVCSLVWSPDGHLLVSGGNYEDQLISVWEPHVSEKPKITLKGHNQWISALLWNPIKQLLLSSSADQTIKIWNIETWKPTATLEGHTEKIVYIATPPDFALLVSKSSDETIRFWDTNSLRTVAQIPETASHKGEQTLAIAFNPVTSVLATLGEMDSAIRIWDIDYETLISGTSDLGPLRYTTAKLVLVGDSGVGKTGLGWRLAHNEFEEQSSTHGQQFWVIPELGKKREDGTECEAVLWDLAGQPDYRLVHSLFLDDVDTALVLFDPTNRQEPLSGVDFWLNQLKRKDKDLCNSILVGARTDRGTSTLTEDELQAYCERNGIYGGYIATSAKEDIGLDKLMETVKAQIPWEEMTATVTTVTFKRIKEYVLELKEQTERKNVLVHPDELRAQLEAINAEWKFSDAEMMTAVGHLANHGYVTILRGSKGEESILLAPDMLANLAASIVLEARRNPRGLGVLDESRLLAGEYKFPELHDLEADEREILLDAAAVLFLEHNLCFRETFNQQTFLVFPSLINEKRPKDENITPIEGASYHVKGAVENVYASLVVLLGYTNTFVRTNQWQNQAQYVLGEGEVCGFQQSDYHAGEIELVLYYDAKTPESTKLLFRGMFERFLNRHDLEIARYQAVFCPKCGSQLARTVVLSQLEKKKDFSFCNACGEKLSLPSPEPLTRLSRREEVELDVQQDIAQRRTAFEAALVRVKALLRDREEESPTCFISYAWGVPEHERWVLQLAKDLRNAGVDVLLDKWHCKPGDDLGRYIDQIESSQFVCVVGTPELKEKYASKTDDRVVATELELINMRSGQPKHYGRTTLPLLVAGDAKESFPPQLQRLVSIDFRQSAYYFRRLFDMIWRLYELPFDNPLLEELQASMSPQER